MIQKRIYQSGTSVILHTLYPYAGIIQIRSWVEAPAASSQPASRKLPVVIYCLGNIILQKKHFTSPLYLPSLRIHCLFSYIVMLILILRFHLLGNAIELLVAFLLHLFFPLFLHIHHLKNSIAKKADYYTRTLIFRQFSERS